MYDLIIKNGRIVDGTGNPACDGDIAIKDGLVASLGSVSQPAKKTIDAKGNLVAPGWVDTHSHMDGQATWDPFWLPFWDPRGSKNGPKTELGKRRLRRWKIDQK